MPLNDAHLEGFLFYSPMNKVYNKTPLSFADQIALLKKRGLIINNEPKALSYLQEINYYRLSAYFLPYQSAKDVLNPILLLSK